MTNTLLPLLLISIAAFSPIHAFSQTDSVIWSIHIGEIEISLSNERRVVEQYGHRDTLCLKRFQGAQSTYITGVPILKGEMDGLYLMGEDGQVSRLCHWSGRYDNILNQVQIKHVLKTSLSNIKVIRNNSLCRLKSVVVNAFTNVKYLSDTYRFEAMTDTITFGASALFTDETFNQELIKMGGILEFEIELTVDSNITIETPTISVGLMIEPLDTGLVNSTFIEFLNNEMFLHLLNNDCLPSTKE